MTTSSSSAKLRGPRTSGTVPPCPARRSPAGRGEAGASVERSCLPVLDWSPGPPTTTSKGPRVTLLWVLVGTAVLGGVAVVAAGRGEGLTPAEPDRPDVVVPLEHLLVKDDEVHPVQEPPVQEPPVEGPPTRGTDG